MLGCERPACEMPRWGCFDPADNGTTHAKIRCSQPDKPRAGIPPGAGVTKTVQGFMGQSASRKRIKCQVVLWHGTMAVFRHLAFALLCDITVRSTDQGWSRAGELLVCAFCALFRSFPPDDPTYPVPFPPMTPSFVHITRSFHALITRMVKEVASYEKEAEENEAKVQKMRDEKKDAYDIRKQEEVMQTHKYEVPGTTLKYTPSAALHLVHAQK